MPPPDPEHGSPEGLARIAAALRRHRVDFVAIGSWAAEALGFDIGYETTDIDIAPDFGRGNLDRLSAALSHLGARVRFGDESFPFDHTGQSLGNADIWNLTCDYGDFDIAFHPSGPGGYPDLVAAARPVNIQTADGATDVLCADIEDIIRSKQAANRPKDRPVVTLLQAQLEARTAQPQVDSPTDPTGSQKDIAAADLRPRQSAAKRDRILAAARQNPKATAKQIARAAGASPGYAAAVLRQSRR